MLQARLLLALHSQEATNPYSTKSFELNDNVRHFPVSAKATDVCKRILNFFIYEGNKDIPTQKKNSTGQAIAALFYPYSYNITGVYHIFNGNCEGLEIHFT